MNRTFLLKTVKDSALLLTACAGCIFAFSWIRVFIVASMEAGRFQRIARNLPDMVKRLSPVPIDELVSYPGLIGFTFEEPMTYLIMAVWTFSRASDSVSGEIGRGTMEMMLAQPMSRTKYLLGHTLTTLMGVAVIATAAYLGTHTGVTRAEVETGNSPLNFRVPLFGFEVPLTKSQQARMVPLTNYVKPEVFRTSAINYFCLGFFLSGITSALSSVDRFRWRTIGTMVGFYILQTVIELSGMAIEGYGWLLNFTFFSSYEPVEFAARTAKETSYQWQLLSSTSTGRFPDLGPIGCDLVLLTTGGLGFLFAFIAFRRRDLPAPL